MKTREPEVKEERVIRRKRLRMAPCQEACPAKVDVPRYIRYIKEGAYDEALAVNMEGIPLPHICSYACFNPCEGRCAMNQFGEPVAIRALKRVCVEHGRDILWKKRKATPSPTGKRVAVVGAGPAGLTVAYCLSGVGHDVTVFDENELPGGTMRYGIPRYRLPSIAIEEDVKNILEFGVKFTPNTKVGRDIKVEDLLREFDAVVVTAGTTLSRKIDIEGAELLGVLWGLDFLRDVSMDKEVTVGRSVVVVGGGNVAIDAALTARRLGAERVELFCLEKRDEMPAHPWEIERAEEEGVVIHNSWGPVRIIGEEGKVKGIEFQRCTAVFDKKGRFNPAFDPETKVAHTADTVIFAIGLQRDPSIEGLLTSGQKGLFVAGDFRTGPSSIVQAIADAKEVATQVDLFLGGDGQIQEQLAKVEEEVELEEAREILRRRTPVPLLPVQERLKGFEPVEGSYSLESARREARRCLNCDLRMYEVLVFTDNCKACGYCKEVCKMGVFEVAEEFNRRGVKPMIPSGTHRCVGCLMCFYACPDFAIEIREKSEVRS